MFPHGKGSFRTVAQNIRLLQEESGGAQPNKIEATYTRKHVELGITITDLAQFFSDEFGINDVYIVPVSLPAGAALANELGLGELAEPDCLPDVSFEAISNLTSDSPKQFGDIYEYVHRLATRNCPQYLCGVGISSFTIDAHGDVYPCYVIMDDDLKVGNILDPEVFSRQRCRDIVSRFIGHGKESVAVCQSCWARPFCHICYGTLKNETGNIWERSPHLCAGVRRRAERALLLISEIQTDPTKWRIFLDNAIRYNPLRG